MEVMTSICSNIVELASADLQNGVYIIKVVYGNDQHERMLGFSTNKHRSKRKAAFLGPFFMFYLLINKVIVSLHPVFKTIINNNEKPI